MLEDIQQTVTNQSTFDTEVVPSNEAVYYHWKRSCWVIHMWRQGDKPITNYGWTLSDNKLAVLWDTPEEMEKNSSKSSFTFERMQMHHWLHNQEM